MAHNVKEFSKYGLNYQSGVDVGALTTRARMAPSVVPLPIGTAAGGNATAIIVTNTTTDHPLGPVGVPCRLVAASYSADRVPSLGAGSVALVAATTDGTTKTILTDALDPEALTVNVGQPWTMATTNRDLAATDVLFFRCVADNNAIATDLRNVKIALTFEVIEASQPTR